MPVMPPKCKFCEHLHWGLCPYVGAAPHKVKVIDPKAKAGPAPKLLAPPPKKTKKAKAK